MEFVNCEQIILFQSNQNSKYFNDFHPILVKCSLISPHVSRQNAITEALPLITESP